MEDCSFDYFMMLLFSLRTLVGVIGDGDVGRFSLLLITLELVRLSCCKFAPCPTVWMDSLTRNGLYATFYTFVRLVEAMLLALSDIR